MNHPTKAQVQVVIDNLLKAQELAGGDCPVAMWNGHVDFDHPCGTPMCHGAWYALVRCKNEAFSYYLQGADMMAEDLGFQPGLLEEWAEDNPEIWGNEYGRSMFSAEYSFTDDTGPELTSLSQIIDHWRGVQSRLPE